MVKKQPKTRAVPITWSEDEWTAVLDSMYRLLDSRGHIPLPIRYNTKQLLRDSQQILPGDRHRTWSATAVNDTQRIKNGIGVRSGNALNELRKKSPGGNLGIVKDKPTAETVTPVQQASVPPMPQPAAPAPAPTMATVFSGLTLEGVGKWLDGYIRSTASQPNGLPVKAIEEIVNNRLDKLLPDLATAVNEQLEKVVVERINTLESRIVVQAKSILDAQNRIDELYKDNVALVEELDKLKKPPVINSDASEISKQSDEEFFSAINQNIAIETVRVVKKKPRIVVTGCKAEHEQQLKRDYSDKLELRTFQQVVPFQTINDCDEIFTFRYTASGHNHMKLLDKAKGVHVTSVDGSMSAMRRHLDVWVEKTRVTPLQSAIKDLLAKPANP